MESLKVVVEDKKTITINKKDYSSQQWQCLTRKAGLNKLFSKGNKLYACKCPECNQQSVLVIEDEIIGEECLLLTYKCLRCPYTEKDLLD